MILDDLPARDENQEGFYEEDRGSEPSQVSNGMVRYPDYSPEWRHKVLVHNQHVRDVKRTQPHRCSKQTGCSQCIALPAVMHELTQPNNNMWSACASHERRVCLELAREDMEHNTMTKRTAI